MTDQNIQTIAIVDPRTLDGNPYEVAEIATAQVAALTNLAIEQGEHAFRMARNAAQERSLVITGNVPSEPYEFTAEGRKFLDARFDLERASQSLKALVKAVAFDPKARLPKGGK